MDENENTLLFCSLFDPIMLCEEAPSVDTLLSTIRSMETNLYSSENSHTEKQPF